MSKRFSFRYVRLDPVTDFHDRSKILYWSPRTAQRGVVANDLPTALTRMRDSLLKRKPQLRIKIMAAWVYVPGRAQWERLTLPENLPHPYLNGDIEDERTGTDDTD